MSIQVFACDHRKGIDWKLPYIRIGGPESDCFVNIKDDQEIAPYSVLMSEGAKIWWVWKHLKEFGNPDYVGFCHYRRFFTLLNNSPIINIDKSQFNSRFCLGSDQQEFIIRQNKADGLVFSPISVIDCNRTGCKTIMDQLKYEMHNSCFGMSDELIDNAFDSFFKNIPNDFAGYVRLSAEEPRMYACNIFTLSRELFDIYCNIVMPVLVLVVKSVSSEQMHHMHPRFAGYLLERFTSCFLYGIQKAGKKLLTLPLMTINGEQHVYWNGNAGEHT